MESDSDIDKSESQAESDSNEFEGNTEASFEWPIQNSSYFEPLYPDANITKCGAYYTIMLYAHNLQQAIHGLTKLLDLFFFLPLIPFQRVNVQLKSIFQAILCSIQTPNCLHHLWCPMSKAVQYLCSA